MNTLEGQVIVVTGGSAGIGYATVTELAREGAQVIALARDGARLGRAVAGLGETLQERVRAQTMDVRLEQAVAATVAELLDAHGRIDALVNAAGVSMRARRPLQDTSTEEWELLLDTNLTGTYLMCRAVLPSMVSRGRGQIVNVNSTAGFRSQPGNGLYSASKYGVRALTESLAQENAGTGVRITSVSPGPVDTDIWKRKLNPPSEEDRARMLRPSHIADIILWLLRLPDPMFVDNITVTPRP